MSKKYKIPVSWQVCGFVTVEADNEEEAVNEVVSAWVYDGVDGDPEYLDDSFEVNEQGIEEVSQ